MNREDLETGKRLLALVGELRTVGQVTVPPDFKPDEIGATIKNKAKGNLTYGYFSDDDPEEAEFLNLVLWLLNNAKDMIACADVAIEAHITVPPLSINTPEFGALDPVHQAYVFLAFSHVCLLTVETVDTVFNNPEYSEMIVQQLTGRGLDRSEARRLLQAAGYKH